MLPFPPLHNLGWTAPVARADAFLTKAGKNY